jgi:uncharacterized phage protein (TIGR01671 family)
MHREIKFRGLRTDGGGWVYGDLVRKYGKAVIITETDIFSFNRKRSIWIENEVHPETVGQFTGLKDKNGREIFEGDVVKWGMHSGSHEYWHRYAKVSFNPDIEFEILFYIDSITGEKKPTDGHVFKYSKFAYKQTDKHLEIIGNIHEKTETK